MTGYTFTRSEGLVHIHAPADPKACVACVRTDAFEVIWQEARREAIQEMRAAVERASGGRPAHPPRRAGGPEEGR